MLSIFRIVAGLVFVSFGTMKLFRYPPIPMPDAQPIPLLSQMGVGGVLETVGGLAITLGLFTRPVAFVLAGEMAVAYFQFHAPQSFWPSVNSGVPAVLYCFFLPVSRVRGAGSVECRRADRAVAGRHGGGVRGRTFQGRRERCS